MSSVESQEGSLTSGPSPANAPAVVASPQPVQPPHHHHHHHRASSCTDESAQKQDLANTTPSVVNNNKTNSLTVPSTTSSGPLPPIRHGHSHSASVITVGPPLPHHTTTTSGGAPPPPIVVAHGSTPPSSSNFSTVSAPRNDGNNSSVGGGPLTTATGHSSVGSQNPSASCCAPSLGSLSEADFLKTLVIGFENVSVTVEKHVVLDKVSGVVRGGCLTGVVSCCGARGDYVLLNVLAGYEECGGGTVLASGTPVFAPAFHHSSVLIDEDFTAMDELTVRQNLQYAASMRVASLDSDTVDSIIELLNLEAVEGKAVSRCNLYTRRRVALGKELLLRPRAIFVDQPVQGLATHEARQYLQILRRVAQHRVVVVTLVQPRWVLLELMDDVILLEGRHVAFSGTSSELLATMRVDSEHIPDSALTSIYRLASSPECSLIDTFKRSGHIERSASSVSTFFGLCATGRMTFEAVPYVRPRAYSQFFCLIRYSLYQVRNNLILYSTVFAVVLILSIILAAIYSSQSGQSGMQNRIGIIFFLVSSTFLHNMLFVESRRKEFLSFERHRAHGYYGSATYLLFVVFSSAFVRFFSSAIFTIVVYSLGNIGSEWEYTNLRDLVTVVALTSYSTGFVVYLVCSLARTVRIAHFVLFALYTFDVILAGIILNVNTLPRPFQVVSLASHIRLGYESAVITQFMGQDFGCQKMNQTVSCYTGDQYLNFLGFEPSRRWTNVELLGLLSGITILAWYLVLVFYKAPRRVY